MVSAFTRYCVVSDDGAELEFCPYGGHLLSWRVAGEEQLLLSSRAVFSEGAAIRGGVPVIFPQFAGLGKLKKHGFVRERTWHLLAKGVDREGAACAELELCHRPAAEDPWPHPVRLSLSYRARARTLVMSLSVENIGDGAVEFTGAFHGYWQIDAINEALLHGLENLGYRDSSRGSEVAASGAPLVFDAEIDRIYPAAPALRLQDRRRVLAFSASGFTDTVVWNPGAAKAAALSDLGEGQWRRFVCVEAAIIQSPVRLAPGERWHGRQTVEIQPLR